MSKRIKIIAGTTSVVLLGFLRDYLFYNINWIYLTLVNGRMNGARKEFYFLLEWTPQEINILKFILTGVFIILFLYMTLLTIRIAVQSKKNDRIVMTTFLIPGLLAVLLSGIGKLTGLYTELYGAIHALMTFIQSFIPLMILGLLFSFLPTGKSN